MTTTTTWRRSAGYVWALLGSAVGFANLLSFSSYCYKGGGGAFLFPYFLAMFAIGIPMLLLESAIGQHFRSAVVEACYRTRGPQATILGWLSVIACWTIGAFYVVLTSYSIIYFVYACMGAIPQDTASFFRNDVLHLSPSIEELGVCVPSLVLATTTALLFTYWVNRQPINLGIEKICSYFMPLLGFLALAGAIGVLFLPGAKDGVARLFYPNMEALKNPSLWRDVLGQLFFSYSLGLGIVVGYSAHADKRIKMLRAIAFVALGDFAFSLLAAIVCFGCIGAASLEQGVAFDAWLTHSSTFEVGFVVYPKLLQSFGGGFLTAFLQAVLFFSLFVAGITGVFSIVESIVGNFQWRTRFSREKATRWTCFSLLIGALPFCFGIGSHLIDALAPQVLGINMLLGAVALIIIFLLDERILKEHALFRSGRLRRYLLIAVLPWAAISLLCSLYQEWSQPFTLATWIRLVWLSMAVSLAWQLRSDPKR